MSLQTRFLKKQIFTDYYRFSPNVKKPRKIGLKVGLFEHERNEENSTSKKLPT